MGEIPGKPTHWCNKLPSEPPQCHFFPCLVCFLQHRRTRTPCRHDRHGRRRLLTQILRCVIGRASGQAQRAQITVIILYSVKNLKWLQPFLRFKAIGGKRPSRYISSFPRYNIQRKMLTRFMGHIADEPSDHVLEFSMPTRKQMALKVFY